MTFSLTFPTHIWQKIGRILMQTNEMLRKFCPILQISYSKSLPNVNQWNWASRIITCIYLPTILFPRGLVAPLVEHHTRDVASHFKKSWNLYTCATFYDQLYIIMEFHINFALNVTLNFMCASSLTRIGFSCVHKSV